MGRQYPQPGLNYLELCQKNQPAGHHSVGEANPAPTERDSFQLGAQKQWDGLSPRREAPLTPAGAQSGSQGLRQVNLKAMVRPESRPLHWDKPYWEFWDLSFPHQELPNSLASSVLITSAAPLGAGPLLKWDVAELRGKKKYNCFPPVPFMADFPSASPVL